MPRMGKPAVSLAASMWNRQGGRCAICRRPTTKLQVDHDHDCCPPKRACVRCLRGMLCGLCNAGLGMFGDDPARLRAAARYLEGGWAAV